jgi:hypothetical protein
MKCEIIDVTAVASGRRWFHQPVMDHALDVLIAGVWPV